MPPANTPRTRSPEPTSIPSTRPLTPLSYLSSPAPNLAATLVTQTEADAEDENLRFLRTPVEDLEGTDTLNDNPPSEDPSEWRRRRQLRLQTQIEQLRVRSRLNNTANQDAQPHRDSQQRDRLQRVLSRMSRFQQTGRTTHPRLEEDWTASATDTPIPDTNTTVSNLYSEVAELRHILDELRRDNPYLTPDLNETRPEQDEERQADIPVTDERRNDIRTTSQIMDSLHQAERDLQALERRLDVTQRRVDTSERPPDSLRSTAIIQHARANASTTERMLRYIRDRERLIGHGDNNDQPRESSTFTRWSRLARGTGFTATDADTAMADSNSPLLETSSTALLTPSYHLGRNRNDTASRGIISRRTKAVQSPVSPFLENTITYLERLRDCQIYDEALVLAIELGFANKEFFADKHDDFIMDIWSFPIPSPSSWLQPGVKFTGRQHTTYQPSTKSSFNRPSAPSRIPDVRRASPLQAHSVAEVSDLRVSQPLEQWPVNLTIHSVDFETMTMSGTMEAHDLPTKDPSRTAPITTFLEGQIIDLTTHTFLTPKEGDIHFPTTSAANDAANWRRLPPFVDSKDDTEVARMFLSQDHLAAIGKEYIFMRWKERCFIHSPDDECPSSPAARRARSAPALGEGDDSDKGHGLTICGFYYISLNRVTGQVMGLYCDPNTSPYQCLVLDGVQGGLTGTWSWR